MSLRIFSRILGVTALATLLAACGSGPEGDASSLAEAEAMARKDVADSGMIECAVAGFKNFTRTCSVERAVEETGLVLTIRHDDGGFRRLRVMKDGSGVVAADGAEPAVVSTVGGNSIEVSVAGDRYRLPATVKGTDKAK